MKTLPRVVAVLLLSLSIPLAAHAGAVVEVRPDSPIIQPPDKRTATVLEDREGRLSFAEAHAQAERFIPADRTGPPDGNSRYWIAQRIQSHLPTIGRFC